MIFITPGHSFRHLARLAPHGPFRDEVLMDGVPRCESTGDFELLLDEAVTAEGKKAISDTDSRGAKSAISSGGWW